MKVDAVVLAGGDGAVIDPTVQHQGARARSPASPMVEWVVDALRAAETIAEIAVVVPTGRGPRRVGRQGRPARRLGRRASSTTRSPASRAFQERPPRARRDGRPSGADAGGHRRLSSRGRWRRVPSSPTRSCAPRTWRRSSPARSAPTSRSPGGAVTGGNMMVMSPGPRRAQPRDRPAALRHAQDRRWRWRASSGSRSSSSTSRAGFASTTSSARWSSSSAAKCAAIYTSHASIGADVDKPIDVVVAERVLYQAYDG